MIQLQSVNKKGLEQTEDLLKGLGIDSEIYSYKRKQKKIGIQIIYFVS